MDDSTRLQTPAGLSATAAAEGIIRLQFEFEGADDIRFEIWRRHGDTVDWYLHTTTGERGFDDSPVEPGQYYEYKVRAVRGGAVSEFTPSAVVYGK